MLIHHDFSRRAMISPAHYRWVASPQPGVDRVMLDRTGGERARATSIVRYAPHAFFPAHPHPGGEEILVLSGTFSEGENHYPAGWYLRNPPGSVHQPASNPGTTIFVKLGQMTAQETRPVRINTDDLRAWQVNDDHARCPLYEDDRESVCLLRLSAGAAVFSHAATGGVELLLIEGTLMESDVQYPAGTWLRLPPDDVPPLTAGTQGALLYVKTGHLRDATPEKIHEKN
ncbi:cupin domain-containing protein [Cronobacter turicensis]|nr:cupin domain-containing protein [Cronobacter turicensis]ELY5816179.1 cupin domain-containing protein [Cronobacter turicensis]